MRVLLVEDELYLAEAIQAGLRLESIAADIASDGQEALDVLSYNSYDIAIVDRDLPKVHGDEVCKHIVEYYPQCRVLMLTAARKIDDKITGFELGADDYLAKPFEFPELVMRLRALARRNQSAKPPIISIGNVQLDSFRREVYRGGKYIRLARKEFAILHVLMEADGGVVSAEALLEKAWDENTDPFTNTIRVTMSTLRKRLGEPPVIHTVAGVGYRFEV